VPAMHARHACDELGVAVPGEHVLQL